MGPAELVFPATSSTFVVEISLLSFPLPPMTRTPPSSGSKTAEAPRLFMSILGPGEEVPLVRSIISVVERFLSVLFTPPMTSTLPSCSITAEQQLRGQLISGPCEDSPLAKSIISVVERYDPLRTLDLPPITSIVPLLKGRAAHPKRPEARFGPGDQVLLTGLSTSVVDKTVPANPPTAITRPSLNTAIPQPARLDSMGGPEENVSVSRLNTSVDARCS
mmetsp:Transcript_30238/g.59900  ORF Transcript_30238/g.59900 Transcript_30238/m.59900 type:complete len:219 (-) Transcript_30238:52-708(-)